MNIYVQQTIQIRQIKIGGVSNSSVFQIGTSGIIKPASYLYNTGGFTTPAPSATAETIEENSPLTTVPLQSGAGGAGAGAGAAGAGAGVR